MGAFPPLIYLLFLARAVCSKGDAPKSNSHSQHCSHLSKKVAKWEWPSSNQLHSCYQHFQEELWDPGEPACVSDQHKQHEVEFISGFKKKTAVIYMQSTLRRPTTFTTTTTAQTIFCFLHKNCSVSEGPIHLQNSHYSGGTFHWNAL